ncbi:DNA glycosylase [Aeromicrobium sp. Root495]|uniref:mismatch-specific DNA-glycosylase n=1 Tax=Aeromicrobium sp. Root495 TaxID=1736550 RepID=UPI0006F8D09B|nr:mismatch-specific DNA-glycosylase [Aeromicrobium sp. Root495]KQY60169.1 DNA glycosylase [Aeromicrobium sp. Root495]
MTTPEPVPDLLGDGLRLLLVGINPSILSGLTGYHFAHPGNRFYPALVAAGIITATDPAVATEQLRTAGVGISNLAVRPTAKASELSVDELREAPARLEGLVRRLTPRVVAVAGVSAYRVAFSDRTARRGRQPVDLGGAELWVVPNPSGPNAHETVASLAAAYAEVADRAGIHRSLPAN